MADHLVLLRAELAALQDLHKGVKRKGQAGYETEWPYRKVGSRRHRQDEARAYHEGAIAHHRRQGGPEHDAAMVAHQRALDAVGAAGYHAHADAAENASKDADHDHGTRFVSARAGVHRVFAPERPEGTRRQARSARIPTEDEMDHENAFEELPGRFAEPHEVHPIREREMARPGGPRKTRLRFLDKHERRMTRELRDFEAEAKAHEAKAAVSAPTSGPDWSRSMGAKARRRD